MPAPVVCVVAVVAGVAGVAAGIAFKEFVYDPHLAPKIGQWADTYAAYRRERRRKRASPHKTDDDTPRTEGKSSVELESIVEREMQDFRNGGVLRHRKNKSSKDRGVEMLEKPNNFIPFEPLSPTRAPSASPPPPNPFVGGSEVSLPAGRLPTPVSDRSPSRQSTSPPLHAMPPPSGQGESLISQDFESVSSQSTTGSRAPSRLTSHYDFVLHSSAGQSTISSAPRSTTPSSDSRATTPFTDARSEASFDFTGSEAAYSEAELLYAAESDVASHAGSDIAQHVESLRIPRADVHSESGSEDWERVSSVGR